MRLGLLIRDAEVRELLSQLAASEGWELIQGCGGADLVFWQPDSPLPADWKPAVTSHVAIVRPEEIAALQAAGKLRGTAILLQPCSAEDLAALVRARRAQLSAPLELRAERDHLLQRLLGAKASLARLTAERRLPTLEQPRISVRARAV